MRAIVGATTSALIAILTMGLAYAATPEDVANDISQQVMSPYCAGVTLHDCPSQEAVDLREEIEQWARDGMTRSQILERLEQDFGAGVLAAPPVGGSGLGAWVVPALCAIAGAVLAAELARRWAHRSPRHEDYDADKHLTPGDRRRVERELRAFKGEFAPEQRQEPR